MDLYKDKKDNLHNESKSDKIYKLHLINYGSCNNRAIIVYDVTHIKVCRKSVRVNRKLRA